MKQPMDGARGKAAAAAALLLITGGLLGVLVDRHWLLPREDEPMPLTARAMAERLELSPSEEAGIHALLDSLHSEVTVAAEHGLDSLLQTAHDAHSRLEAALPHEARGEFRTWIQDHHQQMRERMGEHMGPGSM